LFSFIFQKLFQQVKVPLPRLTFIFVVLSDVMSAYWPVTALFVLAMGAALWLSRRSGGWGKAAHLGLLLICAGLCGGALVGGSLPLIRLLEGVGHR
jgi:type II secretory pathway component PulF